MHNTESEQKKALAVMPWDMLSIAGHSGNFCNIFLFDSFSDYLNYTLTIV